MNAEVAYAYRERKAEAEPVGYEAYYLRALQHLKLKTVVKVTFSTLRAHTYVNMAYHRFKTIDCMRL